MQRQPQEVLARVQQQHIPHIGIRLVLRQRVTLPQRHILQLPRMRQIMLPLRREVQVR